MLELNKIYNMDALDGLKQLDTESIDAIISDPPYQLDSISKRFGKENSVEAQYGKDGSFKRLSKGFMGKEWDVLPSVEILREAVRVLKPGAFALWLMTPRMDSQAEFVMRLKQVGFMISFSPIYWAYASGFPKSANISLLVDKKACMEDLTQKLGRKPSKEEFKEAWKNWREKGEPKTPKAKALNGSYGGFQPKPAVEVIIVSMKPLSEKTYIDQALKNGKGVTWLDNVRIPFKPNDDIIAKNPHTISKGTDAYDVHDYGKYNAVSNPIDYTNVKGRFPANLLVSDNALDIGLKQSIGHNPNIKTTGFGKFGGGASERVDWKEDTYIKDIGDFSRYFSLDEWWRVNFEELPKEQQKIFPFLYVPKASKSERNKGLEKPTEVTNRPTGVTYNDFSSIHRKKARGNVHPTVKPIKLTSYLITLATRQGDIVLDPFIGSGTTAISALLLNRNFIGFEREPEYAKIAEARISYYQAHKKSADSVKHNNEITKALERAAKIVVLSAWLGITETEKTHKKQNLDAAQKKLGD